MTTLVLHLNGFYCYQGAMLFYSNKILILATMAANFSIDAPPLVLHPHHIIAAKCTKNYVLAVVITQ
jgi:hypothetical protein